jgi:hypothetical protein
MVNDHPETLPITTIYVPGFNLPEIDSACIKIGREYTDMITHSSLQSGVILFNASRTTSTWCKRGAFRSASRRGWTN